MYFEAITFAIIAVTCAISYRGFLSSEFCDRLTLNVFRVRYHREYHRLISSGFVHLNWMHLLGNMVTFYLFFDSLQAAMGNLLAALLYLSSIIIGSIVAYAFHYDDDYNALGASGGVAGVIFATIALVPGMELKAFILPFSYPGWIFALLYIAGSSYAIIARNDNIGHEVHLGGAIGGMLMAIAYYPSTFVTNSLPILCTGVPLVSFLLLVVIKPELFVLGFAALRKPPENLNIDNRYNQEKVERQQTLDDLLEKISKKGMSGLNAKEKALLEEYSRK